MALVKCKVCGREIEDDVIKCPHCDSLGPKKGKRIKIILLVVMLLLAAGFGVSFYLNKDRVEKPYEEIVQERHDAQLSQRGLTAALLLRSRLDRPESMALQSVISNEDGSVLCLEFTETDAAGKRQKSKAAFVDGELDRTAAGWKLFCTGKTMRPVKVQSPVL